MKKYNLAPGDFPDITDFQNKLKEHDFSKFQSLKQRYIDDAENCMSVEFPRLMEALPRSADSYGSAGPAPNSGVPIVFSTPPPPPPAFAVAAEDDNNPWAEVVTDGAWALADYVPQYKPQFESIQKNGLVSGAAAKKIMGSSGLANTQLRDIWSLSDMDADGNLDLNEFVVAMYLIDFCKQGNPVPSRLDPEMIPPGK